MRLIDADYILSALNVFSDREHGNEHFLLGIETAQDIVKGVSTIDPKPQWIPVAERLPEKLVPVLIQHTYMEYAGISIGYITTDGYWEWFGYFMGDDMLHHPPGDGLICPGSKYVTAWLPLPEPYKEEHDD